MTQEKQAGSEEMKRRKQAYAGDKVLLCQSEPGNMKRVYGIYALFAIAVIPLNIILLSMGIHSPIQIAFLAAFIICLIWYAAKAVRDGKNWIRLYENHYETLDGSFGYDEIIDMNIGRTQILLKGTKSTLFHVANAEELGAVLRERRAAAVKGH